VVAVEVVEVVEVVVVVVRREAPDQARFGVERVRRGKARQGKARQGKAALCVVVYGGNGRVTAG